jgi:benzylsuccinate synthase
MANCADCKWFFPLEEDPGRGDCVQREDDGKSQYWTAKPVSADRPADQCASFQAR